MTQKIGQYRKKVTDERLENAAKAAYNTKELWYDYDPYHEAIYPEWENLSKEGRRVCLVVTRATLEADAEVIEGLYQGGGKFLHKNWTLSDLADSDEDFWKEWEEIL